jgi:hypothetical protein
VTGAASQLDRLQSLLKDALQREAPIPDDPGLALRIAEHVSGNERLSPAEQADIYRRQFFLRHIDSLIEDHLGLVHFLGDDGFDAFARAYLAKHPPRTPSLRDLGADIAAFAATYEGLPQDRRALCTEMARYELTLVELFDSASVPPPDVKKLAALPEEAWLTRPLVLTPLLRLFELCYPIPDLRVAIKNGECAKEPPPPEQVYYGVFRRDDIISFERLEPEAYELLQLLAGGEPLVPACEKLSQRLTEERASKVEAAVGTWFQKWASWGWILDVNEKPSLS